VWFSEYRQSEKYCWGRLWCGLSQLRIESSVWLLWEQKTGFTKDEKLSKSFATTSFPKTIFHVTHDHCTYWCIIHSSSLTHSLHFRPAILHLLTTRSTVNTATYHHPFIDICCDKLITRPVAIITVPVTETHMLWIIHRADSRAGKGHICCSSIRAVRINVLMLVKDQRVFRASPGYAVNKPIRTRNCHQHI
jgi:hypothetical protein